jgi:hypothetical protein
MTPRDVEPVDDSHVTRRVTPGSDATTLTTGVRNGNDTGRGTGEGGSSGAFPLPVGPPETSCPDDACATAVRLNAHLASKGAPPCSFVRVPAQYYAEDLPFRAACLKAASVVGLYKLS